MKNINPLGLFDDHFLLEKLTRLGDPLQKLNEFINWKIFEPSINEAFKNEDRDLSKGGRPPFDRLMLFRALMIQSLYNLSDDQLEYQIIDRASFKRFLGLKKSDKVPDSKTFWAFREQLIEKEIIEHLFEIFNETLDSMGVFANEGKMIDASFVEVPRQRNTREENKHIKETGTAPEQWKEKPHKLCQKDLDARWTKKNKVINQVIEKGCRNKPLTEKQKASNKEKSRTRVRVEHIFGFVENSMNGSFIRTIGLARAKAKIGMMNLTYNICRCVQLKIAVAPVVSKVGLMG